MCDYGSLPLAAPPGNHPTPAEIAACRTWLRQTIDNLPVRVFLALGRIGWKTVVDLACERDWYSGRLPKFGHGASIALKGDVWLVGSFHPSQQNTFTGKLTEPMFDSVFNTVRTLLDARGCTLTFSAI